MTELNRLRPRPAHLILHCRHSFAITDLSGLIGAGVEGFYYHQTRFLSKMQLTIEGGQPLAVCAVAVDAARSVAYFLAPSPAGADAGPAPQQEGDSSEIVQHAIEIQINRFLGDGLYHDIWVTNHALKPAAVALGWKLDADFADRSEAEQGQRQQNAPVARQWRLTAKGAALVLSYRHPRLQHASEIRFSGAGALVEQDATVSCMLHLRPQQEAHLRLNVIPIFCGEAVPPSARARRAGVAAECAGDRLRLSAPNPVVQRAWDRAVVDLSSLALGDGDSDELRTPAAGVPNYIALFGRDVLVTAFQASLLAPQMMRGTLSLIAKSIGDRYDDRFDEEPGRVIHQRQLSPLAILEKNPFLHYYGDYSACGLFLIDLAWHLAVTGDKGFFLSRRDQALATLDWMDRDGDRDHDGLYEYATRAGAWGEKNQGWKDSNDAILYEDGRMVADPIALAELQGCFYAAKQLMALAFASIGDDHRAGELLAAAGRLKRRFNNTFWMPEQQYFGLALDPQKQLVKTVAADPGQCLTYGIVDDDKAEAVAERLMRPDLFSGWGLRTLSSQHPAYNPFAYHLGSVWPAANSLIGLGLKRYGFSAHLHRLAKAIFDASQLFEYDRLPEVFGGQPRDHRHPHPGIYPNANSPQAWSAGAVALLVTSMLGLIPLAPRETLIVDPDLPEWLPELIVTDIPVGSARIGLRFRRDRSGYTHHEIIGRTGPVRLYRPEPGASGTDRFARSVREALG
jgi:glycogen debranching enzyme